MTLRVIRRAGGLRERVRGPGLAMLGIVGAGLTVPGAAQVPGPTGVPGETVQWTTAHLKASFAEASVDHGGAVTLELFGQVAEGWHVYALKQASGGPTPLRVALDANDFARVAGAPSGSAPQRKFDPSFGLETQFYSGSFTLYLPVRIAPSSAAGERSIPGSIPVSVRYQTCNGRVCEPPKTVHLSVPIDAPGRGDR